MYMDYPKFIVSNQKEEPISIQRVNGIFHIFQNIVVRVEEPYMTNWEKKNTWYEQRP